MKCSKCGFENRPEARFCKQCGQPLQAQAAPPAPPATPDTVCPACGATAKPEARFCPRCGKSLPAAPAPPTPPPARPPSPTADTLPSILSISQPYATPPSPPPPAQPPAYAQPPSQPPPPAAPYAPKRRFPHWAWWVGIIATFLCIATVVVIAVKLWSKIPGTEDEPAAPPTPTQWPTAEATLTAAAPTAPPATEAPTAAPPTETPPAEAPTEIPPTPAFAAQVVIIASGTELRVGDLLTITVAVTNTGQVTFGNLRYQLLGEWEPYLRVTTDAAVEHELDVIPGQSDTATFVLEALQPGTARLQANVTVKTQEDPPSVKPVSSEQVVEISVIQ